MFFNLPINSLSFGNVSYNILRECFDRGLEPAVSPIKEVDLSAFTLPDGFEGWLSNCVERAIKDHKRSDKGIKLWHIQGLSESFQEKPCSFTFHETDRLTEVEQNILKQQRLVFVSSKYTQQVFKDHGIENTLYCPLGFDSHHFHKTGKRYLGKKVKTFGLYGKLESRKNTLRVLSAWIKKFGNQDGYSLNCAISNAFLGKDRYEALVRSTFPNGEKPFNVNFIDFQPKLESYNDVLNAADVDLTGLSSLEGFNLPVFQSLCLGKWAVCLDAHVHRDFADSSNSVLVKSSGMRDAVDDVFFRKGYFVNQGQWFDFTDEDLDLALEEVAEKAKTPNPNGEDIINNFSWKNTVDIILDSI